MIKLAVADYNSAAIGSKRAVVPSFRSFWGVNEAGLFVEVKGRNLRAAASPGFRVLYKPAYALVFASCPFWGLGQVKRVNFV